MKKLFNILSLLLFFCGYSFSQVISFDMELNSDNTITEKNSGESFTVNSAVSPLAVDGINGSALRFDGYSTYAVTSIDSTLLSNSELTFSLWCVVETYPMMDYETNEEQFTVIAGNANSNSNDRTNKGMAFVLGSRGTYKFVFWTGWRYECIAEGKLPRYKWNHLVATIDGPNKVCKLYNNGVEVGSRTCGNSISTNVSTFYIGKSQTELKESNLFNLNTFNGIIDEIEIYNGINTDIINEMNDSEVDMNYPSSYFANDLMRPSFHGMPSAGWTNETHGAIYYNQKFHVFFQKNANGPYMARLNWGHLVSDNLYKWTEEKTAISPEEDYDIKGCWSGCVYSDETLTGGVPNIFYTGVDFEKAMISQAAPIDDNLIEWEKDDENPIISGRPSGLSDDFRDCFIFKNNETYYMIVGTAKDGVGAATLHVYNPSTGEWSNDGNIFYAGTSTNAHGTFWEMPNLTRLGDYWLFTVTPQNTHEGVKTLYWVGEINADGTFAPLPSYSTTAQKIELPNFSKYGYGLLSPTIFEYNGKTLMLGIVPDKLDSETNYNLGWAHTYSLPREIELNNDCELIQKPYSGLQHMRTDTLYQENSLTLNGELSLSPVQGRKAELSATFTIGAYDFGFNIFKNEDGMIKVYYSPSDKTITVDAQNCARISNDTDCFNGLYQSTLPETLNEGDSIKLNLFIDHSILDIFINDKWASSVRVYPTDINANGIEIFADGSTDVKDLKAYVLNENNESGITGIIATNQEHSSYSIKISSAELLYSDLEEGSTINIYALDGTKMNEMKTHSTNGSISLSSKGIYIVQIITNNSVSSKKFIIK